MSRNTLRDGIRILASDGLLTHVLQPRRSCAEPVSRRCFRHLRSAPLARARRAGSCARRTGRRPRRRRTMRSTPAQPRLIATTTATSSSTSWTSTRRSFRTSEVRGSIGFSRRSSASSACSSATSAPTASPGARRRSSRCTARSTRRRKRGDVADAQRRLTEHLDSYEARLREVTGARLEGKGQDGEPSAGASASG